MDISSNQETRLAKPQGVSSWRAWWNLVVLSWQRQARARWLVWIALALLALFTFFVFINHQRGRFSMAEWGWPKRGDISYQALLKNLEKVGALPLDPSAAALHQMAYGSFRAVLFDGSGFFVFSNGVVFGVFATFLLPLWTLSFATEALGREREARNLSWLLSRPLSRPAIFLAKYLAALPWCLLLNLGGFFLLCAVAGPNGRLAWTVYWPGVLWGTLAFAALFHLMGAAMRRPSVMALLYAFFLESIAGNLPGHFKRLSISYYIRCLMFDRAHDYGIRPDRPLVFLPVSGTVAAWMLAGITVVCLLVGMWIFSRKEIIE